MTGFAFQRGDLSSLWGGIISTVTQFRGCRGTFKDTGRNFNKQKNGFVGNDACSQIAIKDKVDRVFV